MSQENVEIVRRMYEAIARHDYEQAVTDIHPAAEWHNTSVYPGPRIVRGPTAIQRFLQDLFDTYVASGITIEEISHAAGVVVLQLHGWGRGKGSGAPVDVRWAHTVRLQDGRLFRVDTYGSYAKALEAAGLSE
jgi:ketosteroid isomerase-like protein